VRKHGSNPQCFVRKVTVFSPHDLALLVIAILKKIDKDNFGKNIYKKITWGNTVAIHIVL